MTNKKWLVFFLVFNRDDLQDFCNELFEELKAVGNTQDAHVIVLLHTVQTQTVETGEVLINTNELLYISQKEGPALPLHKKFGIPYTTLPTFDIQNVQELITATQPVLQHEFPAERTIVVTWDHGIGFGIFNERQEENNNFQEENGDLAEGNNQPLAALHPLPVLEVVRHDPFSKSVIKPPNNTFPQIAADNEAINVVMPADNCARFHFISIDELALFLSTVFNRKVDVLVMMNCCMQMFETGYTLRNCVSNLVAAESIMSALGYDYKGFITALANNPSNKELCRIIIDGYKAKAEIMPRAENSLNAAARAIAQNKTAVFANSLRYYGLMQKLIEYFIESVNMTREANFSTLTYTVRDGNADTLDMTGFVELEVIDMKNLFRLMHKKAAPIAWFNLFYNMLSILHRRTVLFSFIGEEFLNRKKRSQIPTGISIFFPSSIRRLGGDTTIPLCMYLHRSSIQTEFSKVSSWDDFIYRVLKENSPPETRGFFSFFTRLK